MAKSVLEVGSTWNRVKCIEVFHSDVIREYDGVKDVYSNVTQYRLECDCGKVWTVEASRWLGKRRTKDCGCGMADDDGMHVVYSFALPYEMLVAMKVAARRDTVGNLNQWAIRALRTALEEKDGEEGRKLPISKRGRKDRHSK